MTNMKILWDLFRSITKNSANYDEKYLKMKFNSDDEMPLNKATEISSLIIVVKKAACHENNKFYPQVFLDECLYKLQNRKEQKYNL